MDTQPVGAVANLKAGKKIPSLENVPYWMLLAVFVVTPVFFVTSPFLSFQFTKSLFVSTGATLTCAVFLAFIIKKGFFQIVKSPVFAALALLLGVYVASSFYSPSFSKSFLGYGFESQTAGMLLLMSVLTLLVSLVFNNSKKIFVAYLSFLCVTVLLGVFHVLRVWLGNDFLNLGVFTSPTSNTIGKWSELGIFFGISVALSVIALEVLKLGKLYRFFLWAVLVVSLLMVFIVNFELVWYTLLPILTLFFVYYSASPALFGSKMTVVSSDSGVGETQDETRLQAPRRRVAFKTLFVIIILALFILPVSRDMSQGISLKYGIDNLEIRPSWGSTQQVLINSIKTSPIFGAGPNRFSSQWELFRPDINISNFWSTNFSSGVGYVPTSFVETGLLGILAWFGLFISILVLGFKALFARSVEVSNRFLTISSFAVTLFLWVFNIVYVPSLPLFVLSFIFLGLFVSSTVLSGVTTVKTVSFMKYEKLSFVVVLFAIFLLVGDLGLGYVFFEKGRSSIYFQRGVSTINSGGDPVAGENFIVHAAELSRNDIYFQNLAELNLAKIRGLMAQVSQNNDATEEQKSQFQNALTRAIQFSLSAQKVDPDNFENSMVVGRVYDTIVPVKIEGTYQNAKSAYEQALKLSPRNPGIYLSFARLEAANADFDSAEKYLAKSLELKPNFVDAIFMQSQIDVSRGNLKSAIKSVEQVAALSPGEPLIYFRLGILKYESKDYNGAVKALEQSLALSPVYSNAKYFLGLSYSKIGQRSKAIAQFKDLRISNPENTEVVSILSNLEAGRDAQDNGVSITDKSEGGEELGNLPVKEEN